MLNPTHINDIVTNLLKSIPLGVKTLPKDLEKTFKSILQQSLDRLNLVTREEFDAQVKVLERTRAKLETLEKQLNELEK